MRNPKRTLALAAASIAVVVAAPTLYAQETNGAVGSMMRGMMGGGGMMGRMSGMMDHCGAMMQGSSRGDRPNDQWRKGSPNKPEKD